MAPAPPRRGGYNIFVKLPGKIFNGGLALLAAFFAGAAEAAEIRFDTPGGPGLAEYARGAEIAVPLAAPAAPVGAHVYDFKTLYGGLGYPSPDYFGSTEEEVMDLDTYTSKYDSFYDEINGYLRFHPAPYEWYGTGPGDAKVIVEHLDNVFRRAPAIPGDLILFRTAASRWLRARNSPTRVMFPPRSATEWRVTSPWRWATRRSRSAGPSSSST